MRKRSEPQTLVSRKFRVVIFTPVTRVEILKVGRVDMKAIPRKQVVGYNVRLHAWFRRDGRDWIVWCPAVDVMTQSRTRKRALESLREAIELWFESCIQRGVFAAALKEVGFSKVPSDEETPEGVDVVRQPAHLHITTKEPISFSLGHHKGSDYIDGTIPAYIAAKQLGDAARARG